MKGIEIELLIFGGIFMTIIAIGSVIATFYIIGLVKKRDEFYRDKLGKIKDSLETSNDSMMSLIQQIQELINRIKK